MLRRGSIYSAMLHLAVILIAYFGLPHLFEKPIDIEEAIPVDVVTIADKTSPPKAEVKPEPPPPAPPLPEPPKQEIAKPEPPVPPEPQPEPPKPEPAQVAQVPPTPV